MNRKGFTLLELIVVLIVLAALVAIALPQYTSFVERGRAAEAINAIGAIKDAEEAYFNMSLSNPSYASCANTAAIETTLGVRLPTDPANARWTYRTFVVGPTCYIYAYRTNVPPSDQSGRYIRLIYRRTGRSTWYGTHSGAPR